MACPCGHKWYAGFASGRVRKTAQCPSCSSFVLTNGSMKVTPPDKNCRGCSRPLLNNKHCTYCGRPVNEKSVKIAREPSVQFCTDDNMPTKKPK